MIGFSPGFQYKAVMNFKNLYRVLACVIVVSFVLGCGKSESESQAAAAPSAPSTQRTAEDLLGGMRMKSLTKQLELTEEQQAKVKALLDSETKAIAQLNNQADISVLDRAAKVSELQKETYDKIKPLLTPPQLEKFEKMLSASGRRKR